MYKIIGADQKEYGPVSAEQVRRWIAEGRANAQTLVRPEDGADWQPLGQIPEFADVAGFGSSAAPAAEPTTGLSSETLERDYHLDIGDCITRGWRLVKKNFGILFGAAAVMLLIQILLSVATRVPILGVLISLASLVITGPLTAGVYYVFLAVARGQPAEVGDVFAGFKSSLGNLVLGYLIPAALAGLAALPGALILAYPLYRMLSDHAFEPLLGAAAILGGVLAILPAIYLSVSWVYTLPLIIDRRLSFWPAMSASRRMVGKHWWAVFGLLVAGSLLNVAGFLVCCVGLFVSLPIFFGAMMYGYEVMFDGPAAREA